MVMPTFALANSQRMPGCSLLTRHHRVGLSFPGARASSQSASKRQGTRLPQCPGSVYFLALHGILFAFHLLPPRSGAPRAEHQLRYWERAMFYSMAIVVAALALCVAWWWLIARNRPVVAPLNIADDDPLMLEALANARASIPELSRHFV
jgi:hypothetical protein